MADLYNLLDGLEEERLQEEEEEIEENPLEENQQESVGENDNQDDDDDEEEAEEIVLPQISRRDEEDAEEGEDTEDQEGGLDLQDLLEQKDQEFADIAYARLLHAWTQEWTSPELLPSPQETVQELLDALERQEELIDQVNSGADGMTTGNAHTDAVYASLLRIDAERIKFLVSDLLRQRLHKIEAHPMHSKTLMDRMSEAEKDYCTQFNALVESHLSRTVLDHFPQDVWKKLDEPEMIDEPDLDRYVFCRIMQESILKATTADGEDQVHEAGTSLIVRYNRIRELISQGKAELLM